MGLANCMLTVCLTILLSNKVLGQLGPRNLELSLVTAKCITLAWNQPKNASETVKEYQYKCGDTSEWQSVGLNLTVTECGFLPGAVVECSVRAGNDVSSAVSESITTCSEALPVEELDRGSPSEVTGSGRIRWNYFISWQAPASYSCIHSTSPYKLQIDDTVIDDYNLTSYTLYADGNIPLSITVWLRNTDDELSPPTSLSFKTSAGLPPQVAPIDFSLKSSSSACVSLSWEPVRYPNGPVNSIRYQVNCGSAGWAYVSTDNKVCNFEPYSLVECQLRAKSGDRTSNVTAASGRTACGIPFMTSFSAHFAVDNENGQEKIHLLVDWLPAVSLCETLSYYNITVVDLNSRLIFHNQYDVNAQRDALITDNLEPWTTYVVSMIAVNSQGNQSESVSQEIASPHFKPSTKPSISLRFEDDCVYVTLGPPSQPNGAILYYQYACDYLSTFTDNTFGEQKVTLYSDRVDLFSVPVVCWWRPVSKIKCAATAHTSGGSSPEASDTGYTIAQVSVSAILKFFFHEVGGVTVTVYYAPPVPDTNGHVNIRSIVIVVGPTDGTLCAIAPLVNHSYAIQNNLSCYATAEIVYPSDPSANYIYTNFELGNGEYVGKYYNAPLKIWSLYTIYAVLDMYSEVEEESVIQFIEKHTISVVEYVCPPPPQINNSVIVNTPMVKINSIIKYECKERFRIKGNTELKCQWNITEAAWFGKHPKCQPAYLLGLKIGLPLGLLFAIGLIIGIVVLRRRWVLGKEERHVADVFQYTPTTAVQRQPLPREQNSPNISPSAENEEFQAIQLTAPGVALNEVELEEDYIQEEITNVQQETPGNGGKGGTLPPCYDEVMKSERQTKLMTPTGCHDYATCESSESGVKSWDDELDF